MSRPAALVVSHGQPSDPDGPEADMAALAARVATELPAGWRVAGTTLAGRGTLSATLTALGAGPVLVYPHFMSDGWFVSTRLPARLAEAGRPDADVLPPFGLDPAVPALCLARARAGAEAAGADPAATTLLLAAHGSPSDPRAGAVARRVAGTIAAADVFGRVTCGFVDEAPRLADAARLPAPAVCLPFFAARNGHVLIDLPEAFAEAGFPGPTLPPIGTDADVPGLIAAALARHADARAA